MGDGVLACSDFREYQNGHHPKANRSDIENQKVKIEKHLFMDISSDKLIYDAEWQIRC